MVYVLALVKCYVYYLFYPVTFNNTPVCFQLLQEDLFWSFEAGIYVRFIKKCFNKSPFPVIIIYFDLQVTNGSKRE